MGLIPFGSDAKRHFKLNDAVEFREDSFLRKRLFETSNMHFNIYCIAPGQENPLHRHPESDEILYFVAGSGECECGEETFAVSQGELVLVPKDVPHAIRNTHAVDNMVCILVQSPLPCVHVPVPRAKGNAAKG